MQVSSIKPGDIVAYSQRQVRNRRRYAAPALTGLTFS